MTTLERRPSQTARIVELLRSHAGQWVPLPKILDMRPRISQFSARLWEARHEWGLDIRNRSEWIDGERHSWFMLIDPTPNSAPAPVGEAAVQQRLPIAEEARYADPEEQ